MHIGSPGHTGSQEEVSLRSLIRVNLGKPTWQTQGLLLLKIFLPLTAVGRASVRNCTRQSKTRKKNNNKTPLSFRSISIANESIKCTDYTNNCVSHLIQFLSFPFLSVPFTRQHFHFLWGHCLSCPVMLLCILLGEFGWGGFKMQMLKGKANKVLVLPLSKSGFTLPALV